MPYLNYQGFFFFFLVWNIVSWFGPFKISTPQALLIFSSITFLSYTSLCFWLKEGIVFSWFFLKLILHHISPRQRAAPTKHREADPRTHFRFFSCPSCKYYSHHRMVVVTMINILLTVMRLEKIMPKLLELKLDLPWQDDENSIPFSLTLPTRLTPQIVLLLNE